MRKSVFLAIIFSVFASNTQAETIKASVNGLVCSFCATGIEKTFKARAEVDTISVDLESKLVTINTKPEQKFDDETITKLLTDAGYTVVGITRSK